MPFLCLSFPRCKMRTCFLRGRQLYLPESSVRSEQEWIIRDSAAGSLAAMLAASLPFSGHQVLLKRKACHVLKGTSPWSDITLASRIFSSLKGLLPRLEGGGTGRKCLWQMELTFSSLESYVSSARVRITGLLFPREHKDFPLLYLLTPAARNQHAQHCCATDIAIRSTSISSTFGFADLSPDGLFLPPQTQRHSWSSEVFRLLGFAVKCQL